MAILKLGSTGAEVNAWLTFLSVQKLYSGKIDGVFGPKARNGTISFQKRAGFKGKDVDGEVGDMTVAAAIKAGFVAQAIQKPVDKPAASEIALVAPSKDRVAQINEAHLARIDPDVAARTRAIIAAAKAQGVVLQVVQGLRTFAEQDELYKQGRSKPGKKVTNARGGQSLHNYGLAVDLAPVIGGKVSWKENNFLHIGGWASAAGLEWGGAWKTFKDLPHVQDTEGMKLHEIQKLYREGGMAAVWKRVR